MMDLDEHLEELEEGFGDDLISKPPASGPPNQAANSEPPVPQRRWTEAELIKPPAVLTPWLHPQKEKRSRWGAETSEGQRADNLIAAMSVAGKFYGDANIPKPKPKPVVPVFHQKPAVARSYVETLPKVTVQSHRQQKAPMGQQQQMGYQQQPPMGQPMGMMPPPFIPPHMYGMPGMPPMMPGMPPGMVPGMVMPQAMQQYPGVPPTMPSHVPQQQQRQQDPPTRRRSPPPSQRRRHHGRSPRRSPSRTPPLRRSRTRSPPGRPGSPLSRRSRSPPGRPGSPPSRRSRSPQRRRSSPRRSRSPPPRGGGRRSPPDQSIDGVPIEEDPEGNELFVKLLLKKLRSIRNRRRVEALHVDIMSMVKKAVDEDAVEDFNKRN